MSVGARVRELRMEDLDALPAPCRGCAFWQSTRGSRGGRPGDRAAQDAWWRAVQLDWGVPGRAVWRDDALAAFALYAPAAHLARTRRLGPPPGDDVLVLATLWVDPAHRRGGLGRHLVQVVARDAVAHGLDAVEAYALPVAADPEEPGACLVPRAFLESVGFTLHRADVEHPKYRMELRRAVRWQEQVGSALTDVVAALSRRERRTRPVAESRSASSDRAAHEGRPC